MTFTKKTIIGSPQTINTPAHIPADWEIWNAPRPLYGTDWTGPFQHGVFYAALPPFENQVDFEKQFREHNIRLDAWKIEFVPEAEAIKLQIAYWSEAYKDDIPFDNLAQIIDEVGKAELLRAFLDRINYGDDQGG